jgi:protease II
MKLSFLFLLAVVGLTNATTNPAPPTEKKPVFNEYHGVKVRDDYQWLEKNDDPAVKAWSAAQNKHARAYLDQLPDRKVIDDLFLDRVAAWPALRAQVSAAETAADARYARFGGRFEIGESHP